MGCNQSLPAMSCTPRPDDVRDNLSFAEVSEELVHSKYELGLMLGTGGYAQVRAARCVATGTMMAAKVIDLPPRPPPRQRENESLEAGNSVKESGKSDDSFQCEEISSTLEPCPIRANAMREAGMLARLRGVSQVVQLKEVFMTAEHVWVAPTVPSPKTMDRTGSSGSSISSGSSRRVSIVETRYCCVCGVHPGFGELASAAGVEASCLQTLFADLCAAPLPQ